MIKVTIVLLQTVCKALINLICTEPSIVCSSCCSMADPKRQVRLADILILPHICKSVLLFLTCVSCIASVGPSKQHHSNTYAQVQNTSKRCILQTQYLRCRTSSRCLLFTNIKGSFL